MLISFLLFAPFANLQNQLLFALSNWNKISWGFLGSCFQSYRKFSKCYHCTFHSSSFWWRCLHPHLLLACTFMRTPTHRITALKMLDVSSFCSIFFSGWEKISVIEQLIFLFARDNYLYTIVYMVKSTLQITIGSPLKADKMPLPFFAWELSH